MGDFNAKFGRGVQYPAAGTPGLWESNKRGDTLVEWCNENDPAIMNTWFETHKQCLCIWKSLGNKKKGVRSI